MIPAKIEYEVVQTCFKDTKRNFIELQIAK